MARKSKLTPELQEKICKALRGAIKSGGTTRRAAKMVCLDMDQTVFKVRAEFPLPTNEVSYWSRIIPDLIQDLDHTVFNEVSYWSRIKYGIIRYPDFVDDSTITRHLDSGSSPE